MWIRKSSDVVDVVISSLMLVSRLCLGSAETLGLDELGFESKFGHLPAVCQWKFPHWGISFVNSPLVPCYL